MKRVGLVLHGGRPEAIEAGQRLAEMLSARGVEVFALPEDARALGPEAHVVSAAGFEDGTEMLLVLGGDGTFLRAAELARHSGTPLLGINMGRLGFLAAIERHDVESALDRLLTDGFSVTERMAIEADVRTRGGGTNLWAVNDVVVAKRHTGRIVNLSVTIDGELLSHFAADGLIVATPTGSTAYSFSAHGPIVAPDLACMILTPISPHRPMDRSIVVPADSAIEIAVLPDPDEAGVSADGRYASDLTAGDHVVIRRSAHPLRMARLDRTPFWRLVSDKFRFPRQR